MKKTNLNQSNNIKDDLFFWIKEFIATKAYTVKVKEVLQKKRLRVGELDKEVIHQQILNSSNMDELREHVRVARTKGLYNLPDYLNPLFKLYMYVLKDKNISDIKNLNTNYINSYIEIGLSENTAKTQTLHYDQMRSLFKFIESNILDDFKFNIGFLRSGKRATNPIDKTKSPKQTFLEPDELVTFLKKVQTLKFNHPNIKQTIVMLKFLSYGGLRKEELVNLTLKSVYTEKRDGKKYLKIDVIGKGSKERVAYINYALIKEDFEAFLEIRQSSTVKCDALFITRDGEKYSHRTVEDIVFRALKGCGFGKRGLTPHSLRRSYATYLYAKGVRIEEISKLLGHNKVEMSEIYIFLTEQKKYEVVDLLENI
ncbi:MAG: hypothetical protein A3F91_09685 [Flavobacteria bacterium RIFCSPLOWO2_12_FULL_35_11]|nr:MAG: hypothetical protein A3F91_09685 [Flavobacteria bacterium RIFCSPLOWO2_12_FULL_35_11]